LLRGRTLDHFVLNAGLTSVLSSVIISVMRFYAMLFGRVL
jgi:hypothetical protein